MKKSPKDSYLQKLKPDAWLGNDRSFYQNQLEMLYSDLNFSPLDDTSLMNIYETGEEEMEEALSEYFEMEG